jgi:hypothetical protein
VLDEELFDRVFALETAHQVWMQLKEIHVGNKKIHEEKYELPKVELNEFEMNDDEGVEQMYSRMGVLIQNINALDVANLTEQEIIQKILQTLPKPKYNIVKALLFEKDFSTLTITEFVNKIHSHEMFMMEEVESPTSNSSAKKDLALKASEKIKPKKTNAKPPSSSSECEGKSDCETWVPTGPHRPGSQPSPTGGPDLPEDPLTCPRTLPDLTCGTKDMKTAWCTRQDSPPRISFPCCTD